MQLAEEFDAETSMDINVAFSLDERSEEVARLVAEHTAFTSDAPRRRGEWGSNNLLRK